MVGRRREPGMRRTQNGGYVGQQGNVVIRGRGRGLKGVQRQRGVYFKCQGSGHYKYECRDPIVFRHCQRVGHYEAACPLAVIERKEEGGRYEGVEKYLPRVACLVGEIVEGEVDEEEISKTVLTRHTNLKGSMVKKL